MNFVPSQMFSFGFCYFFFLMKHNKWDFVISQKHIQNHSQKLDISIQVLIFLLWKKKKQKRRDIYEDNCRSFLTVFPGKQSEYKRN